MWGMLSMVESANVMWWVSLALSLITGALLGFVYFFGLWITLRQLPRRNNPGLWMLSSLPLRLGFVLSGFYLIMRVTGWQGLLAALLGFTLVRLIIVRRYGPVPHIQGTDAKPS